MRKQNVVLSSLIGMYLISGVTFPSSADDVYVDLSVLSALRGNEEFVTDSAPLFPDIKNTPKTTTKKKTTKAKKLVARKKIMPKSKPVIKVLPVEQQAPVVEVKKEVLTEPTANEPDLSSESAQVDTLPVQENVFAEAKKQQVESADIVTSEENIVVPDISVPQSIIPQDSLSAEVETTAKQDTVETPMLLVEQPVVESVADNADTNAGQPAQVVVEPTITTPQTAPIATLKNNQISFAEGVDELSDEQKQQLDAIISSFSNPNANMIAINSYNYDDGTDVFNKKRLSLRRIVAVRSYLLNLGYKNFMPKVINLTDDISKSNIVELEEIK